MGDQRHLGQLADCLPKTAHVGWSHPAEQASVLEVARSCAVLSDGELLFGGFDQLATLHPSASSLSVCSELRCAAC